jgi:hypothetical protein
MLLALAGLALVPPRAPRGASSPTVVPASATRVAASDEGGKALLRNPFQYGDEVAGGLPRAVRSEAPIPAVSPTPSPTALVHLVGFLRGSRGVEAVLSIEGEVGVGGVGTVVEGYAVLSVDPDEGVKLRDPSGHELLLPPPA